MEQVSAIPPRAFGETLRRDPWRRQPLLVIAGLGAFGTYATWAAFQGVHYTFGPYISPFYSPEVFGPSIHSLLGPRPDWVPHWVPASPALLILWAPGGFRLTCYYYRGAYYKAFFADPAGCAVGEPRRTYTGETSFPLILQNIHRYFLLTSFVFLFFLAQDVWEAAWFTNPHTGAIAFGMGIGTLVLALNVVLLGIYAISCHSMRHLIGGFIKQFSRSSGPGQYQAYRCATCLNTHHMRWAWLSLFWVGFSDLYVRLCSMGIWHDLRLF